MMTQSDCLMEALKCRIELISIRLGHQEDTTERTREQLKEALEIAGKLEAELKKEKEN